MKKVIRYIPVLWIVYLYAMLAIMMNGYVLVGSLGAFSSIALVSVVMIVHAFQVKNESKVDFWTLLIVGTIYFLVSFSFGIWILIDLMVK